MAGEELEIQREIERFRGSQTPRGIHSSRYGGIEDRTSLPLAQGMGGERPLGTVDRRGGGEVEASKPHSTS